MKELAQVSWDGGTVFLPIATPYDWELLLDYLKRASEMHGEARLGVNWGQWVVHRGQRTMLCGVCHRPVVTTRHGVCVCEDCGPTGSGARRPPHHASPLGKPAERKTAAPPAAPKATTSGRTLRRVV
jgi:hypothetical protein